jgi:hypothetical protein
MLFDVPLVRLRKTPEHRVIWRRQPGSQRRLPWAQLSGGWATVIRHRDGRSGNASPHVWTLGVTPHRPILHLATPGTKAEH